MRYRKIRNITAPIPHNTPRRTLFRIKFDKVKIIAKTRIRKKIILTGKSGVIALTNQLKILISTNAANIQLRLNLGLRDRIIESLYAYKAGATMVPL